MKQFSIIILTFNEEGNIRRCLDSVKDFTTFSIQPPATKKVIESWTLKVMNPAGKAVMSFEAQGDPPRQVQWDGNGKSGQTLDDGAYSYQLITVDQAGNRGSTISKTLVIDNTPPLLAT